MAEAKLALALARSPVVAIPVLGAAIPVPVMERLAAPGADLLAGL